MNSRRIWCLSAAAVLLATGCATPPADALARHGVLSVGVEKLVHLEPPEYGERSPFSIETQVAELITDAANAKAPRINQMLTVMQKHQIDVPSMVYSNFVAALQKRGLPYTEQKADAVFLIRVAENGFDSHSYALEKSPFIVLEVELTRQDGTVLWKGDSEHAHPESASPTGVRYWDDYEKNPELLRRDWQIVIVNAVDALLDHQ